MDQRVNRTQIGGGQVGPVEGDGDGVILWRGFCHDPMGRVINPAIGHRLVARHRPGIEPGGEGKLRQRRLGRHRAAGITERRQPPQGGVGQGGQRIEPGIFAPVARQHGQSDAPAAGEVLHRRQAIGPIALAADQPDQDALGF